MSATDRNTKPRDAVSRRRSPWAETVLWESVPVSARAQTSAPSHLVPLPRPVPFIRPVIIRTEDAPATKNRTRGSKKKRVYMEDVSTANNEASTSSVLLGLSGKKRSIEGNFPTSRIKRRRVEASSAKRAEQSNTTPATVSPPTLLGQMNSRGGLTRSNVEVLGFQNGSAQSTDRT
ncbi:uncharacterized protein FIBRA_02213 [Fibroporia radiculosa]|uniref:Uncharacterized protein n=1 Tax=Fibroporia radiculosa TaxID=599839 RepID=J4GMM8_9APHY|nr:uncharacterized protein FIBRA_02213 [Fibroporia radiculosa]CCM00185.1 predicted protein [Fibroporia radiculosa]